MKITSEEVKTMAVLSKFAFDEDGIAAMEKDMRELIGFFDELSGVDVTEVSPTYALVPGDNIFRKDEVAASMSAEDLLSNAYEHNDRFYFVPRIIE